MTFRAICRTDLPASQSPFRVVVDEVDRELEWANRFLDAQCVSGVARLTLRSSVYSILHFVRWWSSQPGVDVLDFRVAQFTESTLVDYVRAQVDELPKPSPECINNRSSMLRRLFRFHFQQDMPHAPYLIQRNWYRRSPLGYGRGRVPVASADLKIKVPQREIRTLTGEQVDLLFSQSQIRAHGKGSRVRILPVPPETMRIVECYLKTERPRTNSPEVFVSLKGRARGTPMTPAGLRSLFRHHRKMTGVQKANPHRFRHTFGSDMICAGVSLPALQRLMGHSHIHTTMIYIHFDATGCIRRVRAGGRAHRPAEKNAAAMRKPPHPLEEALQARVRLLATTLRPSTVKQYQQTVRLFMRYLRESFPEVRRPSQLRRDPHMLGWFEYLWVHRGNYSGKPWCRSTRGACLIRLRRLFDLLADHAFPPRPGLVLGQDIPRSDQVLPRPLTPQDDELLVAELRRRNDLYSNALLLTRWTGMRIGETADLSADCLRCLGDGQWAVHVPIGKLHNDRLVPVEAQAREVIARLEFFRMLPGPEGAAATPEFLLPRAKGRDALCVHLRAYLSTAATQAGITAHIVPHQMRHTFATSMLRAGVSLPALMKLLGHRTANMTLRYVEVTQKDLQREFHQARQSIRHLVPLPASANVADPDTADATAVVERLSSAIRVLDLYRQHLSSNHKPLQLLLRRLVRIRSRFQKLTPGPENEK